MDKIVVFATYYDPMEAQIIKTRLIDAGIQCFLTDENMGGQFPYNQAIGGIKLNLFENEVELANSLLAEEF